MSVYQRPVLILSNTQHEIFNENDELVKVEEWWEGSFRGPNVPGLESVKDFFTETGFAQYTAGHANAGGIGIRSEDLEKFRAYCNAALQDFDFTPIYKVDLIYDAKELKQYETDFYNIMEYNNIWGQEVAQPFIVIENVKVTKDNLQLMKGTTLKIIPSADADISAIKFKVSEQEYENLYSEAGCVTINVLGVCERNTWNNKPQIIIKDYEIVDRQQYYF
jgi:single-stranded DNA-specific DHH superfamily exonuclease